MVQWGNIITSHEIDGLVQFGGRTVSVNDERYHDKLSEFFILNIDEIDGDDII